MWKKEMSAEGGRNGDNGRTFPLFFPSHGNHMFPDRPAVQVRDGNHVPHRPGRPRGWGGGCPREEKVKGSHGSYLAITSRAAAWPGKQICSDLLPEMKE